MEGAMATRIPLLFLAACWCGCRTAPPIDFVGENVTIEILGKRVRVAGVYYLENNTPVGKRIRLYYPFPVDAPHHYPDSISIALPFERDPAGVFFWVALRPNSIDSFKVTYEQHVEGPPVRYITTTARTWARPIKEARFTIIAPDTLEVYVNHGVSERVHVGPWRYYSIRIEDYYPVEDLIITW